MNDKWYVFKLEEERLLECSLPDSYIVLKYRDGLEQNIIEFGYTTILITPSRYIAETLVRKLNGQIQE